MALLRNSDQTIRRFIGDIIEDVVGNRTQLRLTREELLKLLISFSKRNRLEGDSRATLDEWLLSLNHSVFYKDYVVKYIPVVDALSFQWVPPWENMVWASEIRNANLKQDLCESITEMTFGEFEYLMRQVFIRTGWASDIAVTKASQDDGIDFHGKYIGEPSGLVLPLVGQAKHWKTKVGSEEIRTFLIKKQYMQASWLHQLILWPFTFPIFLEILMTGIQKN